MVLASEQGTACAANTCPPHGPVANVHVEAGATCQQPCAGLQVGVLDDALF